VNLSYTGCIIYPLKETCFSKQLSWAQSQRKIQKMKIWYELWSKQGATPYYKVEVSEAEEFIKGFNWLEAWTKIYFLNRGVLNLKEILPFTILFIIIFYRNKKKFPERFDKKIYTVPFVILILFSEWFYKHPILRYGGYSLLASLIFLPSALFLSYSPIREETKKKLVTGMVIATLLIFNVRNIIRIDKEINIYDSESFPFFYVPKIDFVPINLKEDINIYIPISRGCWAIKTPCAAGAYGIHTKKILGYNVFIDKIK
jgi:hypothetical protein